MEVFLYFGLLMLLLGGLIIWVLNFMQVKTTLEQAITMYLVELQLSTIFEKAAQLGDNAYLKFQLPSHLLGYNYTLKIAQAVDENNNSIEGYYLGEIIFPNNASYGFLIRTNYGLSKVENGGESSPPFELESGKTYVIYTDKEDKKLIIEVEE